MEVRIPPINQVSFEIVFDFHSHSIWSDGKNTIQEMISVAHARNLTHFALTDHYLFRSYRPPFSQIKNPILYLKAVRDATLQLPPNFTVFAGLEVNAKSTYDLEELLAAKPDLLLFENYEDDLSILSELVELADSTNVPIILAHPFFHLSDVPFKQIYEILENSRLIIELNLISPFNTPEIKKLLDCGLKYSVGSDSHSTDTIGQLSPIYEYLDQNGKCWQFFLTNKSII